MVKSILITKYLRKFLLDNQELQKVIRPTNIYPIIANQNTPFPYIVMQRTGIISKYSKGGFCEDSLEIEIITVSNDYSQSIEIAQLIRETLDGKRYRSEEIWFDDIQLQSATEEFVDNAYIQRLSFSMNIRDTEE